MSKKVIVGILGAACFASAQLALAAPITFSTEASFLAAAGGGLSYESFESATHTGTTVSFAGGTFGCNGGSFCPGFFGISSTFVDSGNQSVFFATPDTSTFNFTSSGLMTMFGIAIGGAGDVAPINLTATLSNGSSVDVLGAGHTGPFTVFEAGDRQYFGIVDSAGFSSITFSADNSGDGIFFDSMSYGGSVVPEPTTLALFGFGLAGFGFSRRKKS